MLKQYLLTGVLAIPLAFAAQLAQVSYPNNATSKAQMYIYVPDKVVTNPPLVRKVERGCSDDPFTFSLSNWKSPKPQHVLYSSRSTAPSPDPGKLFPPTSPLPLAQTTKPQTLLYRTQVVVIHSCQSSAQAYFQNALIPWHRGSDAKGYITLWPSSPNSGTCWDVSSKASLTHGGGGDSQAISNMISYALTQYKADASRVFVMGGSSGAMMSNVLAATYPAQISAVSLYSGVAAGCFVSASGGVDAWNSTCANGQSTASADAWGNIARAMDPSYNGTRPKMQIWHGSVDTTVYPQNYQEEIKQWTNVFGVSSQAATDTKPNTPQANYQTNDYGPNVQGIYATGVGHSVPANLSASEAWFGL